MLRSSLEGVWRSTIALVGKGSRRRPQRLRGLNWANKRKRWGASIVEMAVVSPFALLVLLGMIEVARGIMVNHLLNNAAQAGARAGSIEGTSTASIQTIVVNALTTAGVKGDTVTVQVNDGSTDASSAVAGDQITVYVNIPVSSFTWVPVPRFLSGTLQGQYTMRRE